MGRRTDRRFFAVILPWLVRPGRPLERWFQLRSNNNRDRNPSNRRWRLRRACANCRCIHPQTGRIDNAQAGSKPVDAQTTARPLRRRPIRKKADGGSLRPHDPQPARTLYRFPARPDRRSGRRSIPRMAGQGTTPITGHHITPDHHRQTNLEKGPTLENDRRESLYRRQGRPAT